MVFIYSRSIYVTYIKCKLVEPLFSAIEYNNKHCNFKILYCIYLNKCNDNIYITVNIVICLNTYIQIIKY